MGGVGREFSVFPGNFYVNSKPIEDINVVRAAFYGWIEWEGGKLGQRIYNIPAVTGWPAYHQAPYDEAWLNGATYGRRITFIDNALNPFGSNQGPLVIGSNNMLDDNHYYWQIDEVDLFGFSQKFSNAYDPVALVEDVCEYFFSVPIHETVQTQLKSILLASSSAGDYTWTELWNLATGPDATEEEIASLKHRLRTFYKTICKMEEYHIM